MKYLAIILCLTTFLAGCAADRQLDRRPGGNPLNVDLSGQWVLRDPVAPPTSVERTIRIPPPGGRPGEQYQRRKGKSEGALLRVFLQSGNSLKVTQTAYGLFFSFDRAIVEDYNFGEQRMVSVGPIEAQRVSGWAGRTFVAETMDEEGYVLKESWHLEKSGDQLVRDIRISRDDETAYEAQQVFVRP